MRQATVIGAGLAGCEAAWQLAIRGIPVTLIEMKPEKFTPAHHSAGFAELVCSNSLRSDQLTNAVGLLKEEMRQLGSLIMRCADGTRVPAGGALAVDREAFSKEVTAAMETHPLITVVRREVTQLPRQDAVVATGPLTSDALAKEIAALPGLETLNFYDAAAPIVSGETLDMSRVFRQGRYGRGDDYLNCPMNREEYEAFYQALLTAEKAEVHDFDGTQVFEGCMPIEVMASRGEMVMAFGPMKPVGLTDPRTGREPYAAVQLRAENREGTMYNLVGFQTRLKWGEQKRVFSMIPGLEHAEFLRYGVMHRNTFLHSPGFLDETYQMIARPGLYFAGQMTGVEGYVESASSGLVAGLSLARRLLDLPPVDFTRRTAIGALAHHVSGATGDFQPMNANFGLIEPYEKRIRNKQERYGAIAARALDTIEALRSNPLACDFDAGLPG
ncbi:MAG: methylenetetrahydrofolate--tRNA-(uracil(54)-C(5))-methyltransferase (FADH(2)-oxidizing) TrmFO [Clostridiales bacterium]|nr:methylenetetrahydrofolate--tRNA-(uracil(54)-C(5))-methyltransferase (FADH(2)-oxidizing) TrmFO [Clostridiales bacterium]MDY5513279.1 methylenetetrahydrofolate--tRNA-(uracil(54)-C(5))-methyltransferase (FADH(2)-oxidizing) TrmFO [Candidatus Ventricola sp.]